MILKIARTAALFIACLMMANGNMAKAQQPAQPPAIVLAENGKATIPIYLIDADGELAKNWLVGPSLEDLTFYLQHISNAEFKVETIAALHPQNPGIYVGLASDVLGEDARHLQEQELLLRSLPGSRLLVTGGNARGVSHAIYGLLEELGVRWYYPGEEWAVAPKQNRVSLALDMRSHPDFPINRRIWIGHGLHSVTIRQNFADWQRRNRIAQPFDVSTSHSWFGLDPEKDFATNPEWFAEVDGERRASKPEYVHPQVVQKGIDSALKYFASNPHSNMVSMSPPDGLNYSTSALALEQAGVKETHIAHGVAYGTNAKGELVSVTSENVFYFINQVAKAVQEKYPGKMIGILAYSAYAHPPSFDIEPNVFVELTSGYRRTPLTQTEQIEAYAAKARHLGIYEYFDVEQWSWNQPGRARAANLEYLQTNFRYYHDNNMRALSGEMSNNFGPNGVGYYVIARLLWDAHADVREIEEELYRAAFGPASEPIKRMYRRWETNKNNVSREAVALAYRDLDQAARLTQGQPEYRERVDRLRMYAHFLRIYLQPKNSGASEAEDLATWTKLYGEEEAKARVCAMGEWTSRLMDTSMTHSFAFNRYFVRRGKLAGCDIENWTKPGVIPTTAEIETIFQEGLADLADVTLAPLPVPGQPDNPGEPQEAEELQGLVPFA